MRTLPTPAACHHLQYHHSPNQPPQLTRHGHSYHPTLQHQPCSPRTQTQAEYSMACMQTVVSDRAFCFINDWCLHPCICCSWKMKFCPAFESSRFGTTNALVLPADWAESCTPYGWSDGACSAGRRLLAKGAKDDKDEASFEDDGETLRQSQARSRHSRRLDKCAAG